MLVSHILVTMILQMIQKNQLQICPKSSKNLPKICPKSAPNLPKIRSKSSKNPLQIFPKSAPTQLQNVTALYRVVVPVEQKIKNNTLFCSLGVANNTRPVARVFEMVLSVCELCSILFRKAQLLMSDGDNNNKNFSEQRQNKVPLSQ